MDVSVDPKSTQGQTSYSKPDKPGSKALVTMLRLVFPDQAANLSAPTETPKTLTTMTEYVANGQTVEVEKRRDPPQCSRFG